MTGLSQILDDEKRSMLLALGLGALGGIVMGIAVGIESTPVLIVGFVVLMASAAVWTIRGIREDHVADD